ncbi:MAG: ExbD/TolR family protein [Leptolyngbyaceae cyanobacterium]
MKPRHQSTSRGQTPEVNLVPLMDVLMSVLTFFIIISMNLGSQSILSVEAPAPGNADDVIAPADQETEPLVIGLNQEGELLMADIPVEMDRLASAIRQYLAENPEGYIRLKADRSLNYRDVTSTLTTLREMGSGRVSLVIQ